jgi:hypothetical protein
MAAQGALYQWNLPLAQMLGIPLIKGIATAVVNLKVEDYYPSGKRFLLRFKEKGGKEKELPVHQRRIA